jgi:hypothetical protein
MKSFVELRIRDVLADHDIDIFTDGKGTLRTVDNNPFGAREVRKHKSYFAAADYFAPILRDERLNRIVAAV